MSDYQAVTATNPQLTHLLQQRDQMHVVKPTPYHASQTRAFFKHANHPASEKSNSINILLSKPASTSNAESFDALEKQLFIQGDIFCLFLNFVAYVTVSSRLTFNVN